MSTSAPPFLRARWTDLLMLNYEVDPAVLSARVPRGTALDLWHGRCLVSMVGFLFLDTRVLGVPVPLHRNFEEVNLRFYVTREVNGVVRRGTVFVKEIVPRRAIAWVARALYNEPYVRHPMSHARERLRDGVRLTYGWNAHGVEAWLAATTVGQPRVPSAESEAAFITEHYWGYNAQRDGSTMEYQVEHPQWRVWDAVDPVFECDIAAMYGGAFTPFLSGTPSSVFVAEGSAVTVRQGVRMR